LFFPEIRPVLIPTPSEAMKVPTSQPSSIHVMFRDKRAQSTQVNPSGSDASGVSNLTVGALLNLGNGIGNAAQFVPQIVAIGTVVPPLVEFVSAALDLVVEFNIEDVIYAGRCTAFGVHGRHLPLK
jgi:hypothetical protein